MEKSAEKRRREANHRWTEKETRCLLEAIAQKVEGNPKRFEKPTAQKFYGAVCDDAALRNISALGHNVIKNKMRYLRKTYVSVEEWKRQTGAGLLEEGNEQSVKEYVEKICPHYGTLEQIFGLRKNVVLPYNFDSYGEVNFENDCSFDYAENLEISECIEVLSKSQEEGQEESHEKHATDDGLKKKIKLTSKEKKSNSALDFLAKSQEKRNELEERKLASQEKMEERRLILETKKLELQREQLEFQKVKHQNEFEIQKIKLANEMELKKMEMELKLNMK